MMTTASGMSTPHRKKVANTDRFIPMKPNMSISDIFIPQVFFLLIALVLYANGNDLLNYHSKIIDADYYFQLFITAPLLKKNTINNCIKILRNNKKYDSILTSKSIYSWFWFKKKPVNYSPKILPRSQDAKPIVGETTGLYGIKKKALLKEKARIGKKPFFYEVTNDESIDLDTDKDFQLLEYILKKKSK